jgi:hypothetical protein
VNPYLEIYEGLEWVIERDRGFSVEDDDVARAITTLCERRPELADLLAPVNHGKHIGVFRVRDHCRKALAYAVPSRGALRAIVEAGPRIVEVGAGTGYWAALLAEAGAKVRALDNGSWKLARARSWFAVEHGTPRDLAAIDADLLLLCWPPYDDSMASRALTAFRGPRVAYIGEGEGGCTANQRFHDLLADRWRMVRDLSLPQWPGLHDRLTIYERQEAP